MSYYPSYGVLVTTSNDLPGYHVVETLGLVRGITVRSATIGQGFNRLFSLSTYLGGKQESFVEMCEQARQEAFHELVEHAQQMGANAVIAMRYDATELGSGTQGMTEVLAYGTAVRVERA